MESCAFLVTPLLVITVTTLVGLVWCLARQKRDAMRSDMRDRLRTIRGGGDEPDAQADDSVQTIHIHGNGHTFIFARIVQADNMTITGKPERETEAA